MGILNSLPHLATAYVRARAQDAYGGSRDSLSVVFTEYPCWQQAASDVEARAFDKRGITVTDKVYFTFNPQLDERHVLEINGVQFDVVSRAVPDASVGKSIVWRVMLSASTTEGTSI